MDEKLDELFGLDKKNEIFSLWYEIIFIRKCINHLISHNALIITPEVIEDARQKAQDEVRLKFPLIMIDFKNPNIKNLEENQSQITHEEHFDVSHLPSNEG